jgi:uncharacterized RDD family membrane protein YckC
LYIAYSFSKVENILYLTITNLISILNTHYSILFKSSKEFTTFTPKIQNNMEDIITNQPVTEVQFVYAGFWRRFVAAILDYIVLAFIYLPLRLILHLGNNMIDVKQFMGNGTAPDYNAMMDAIFNMYKDPRFILSQITFIFISVTWFAGWEASKFQATPGKIAIGLKVCNMEGVKISFLNGLGRNFGKQISKLIIYVGYMMAGWTQKKQALHDMMANCLVIIKA